MNPGAYTDLVGPPVCVEFFCKKKKVNKEFKTALMTVFYITTIMMRHVLFYVVLVSLIWVLN